MKIFRVLIGLLSFNWGTNEYNGKRDCINSVNVMMQSDFFIFPTMVIQYFPFKSNHMEQEYQYQVILLIYRSWKYDREFGRDGDEVQQLPVTLLFSNKF